MRQRRRFRPNSPPIIQETIDQETIMVNLESGCYYSLNPVGTHVWLAIERGTDVGDIAGEVAQRFDAEAAAVEPKVRAFVDRLLGEELIVALEDDAPPAEEPSANGSGERTAGIAYEDPVLNRYTDMQELLLLDPVHEVDAAGWPARN
jgi:Coenzyme PQQ synthesis protein D (PqqD)